MSSSSSTTPATILHMMSIGFESLVLETWLDLKTGNEHNFINRYIFQTPK